MYKYNMGGTVPRETTIGGQRHNLAYINPFEEDLLNTQYRGGEGQAMAPFAGPGGVPAYPPSGFNWSGKSVITSSNPNSTATKSNPTATKSSGFGGGSTYNPDNYSGSSGKTSVSGGRGNIVEKPGARNTAYKNLMATSNNDDDRGPVFTTPAATSAGGSATSTADKIAAAKILREAKKITPLESLANFFTQGSGPDNEGSDFMRYNEAGELVYEIGHPTGKAGELVDPNKTNSFGFKVGMANSNANDAEPGRFNQGIGSGIKTDLDMAFAAGFGTPEQQEMNLRLAGYSKEDAAAFAARTKDTMARNAANPMQMGDGDGDSQAGVGVGGIDPFAFTGGGTPGKAAADPCPEGFIMDPATNACVPMDDTNSGYLGLPSYVTPNPSVPLTDFSQPAVLGQPNLQPYAPISSGTGGNFIQGSNRNNFNRGGPVGGIMDLLR